MAPARTTRERASGGRGAGIDSRVLLLSAALAFTLISVQVADAGERGGAEKASHGKKHSKSSKRQLRELRRMVDSQAAAQRAQDAELQALRIQLAALQGQPGSVATPTGTAGGDLTGSYPNPTVAAGAIDAAKVADGSLTDADIDPFNLDGPAGTPSLRTLGTGANQALAGNATPGGPPTGSAGGALAGTYPNPTFAAGAIAGAFSTDLRVGMFNAPNGAFTAQTLQCADPDDRLLSGGVNLFAGVPGVDIAFDAPQNGTTWRVELDNNSGAAVDFQIRALCLEG